jgi:hypothetical protein
MTGTPEPKPFSDEFERHVSAAAAGRTERQQAIAALIAGAVIANGIYYGGGDSDVVSVHSATVGYQIIDALREHGLAVTRLRR